MKAKDYMYLPKKRLAELLEERDNLEELIENIVARKIAEITTQPIIQFPQSEPNPFTQPITVAYGCPTDLNPIIYSKGETTSVSKTIEQ